MRSIQVADVLRAARRQLGLSQAEVARRSGVSVRLAREVERGERPHVSLETALRLMEALGITMRLDRPGGVTAVVRTEASDAVARAARAAHRRAAWTGGVAPIATAPEAPLTGAGAAHRVRGVTAVSAEAHRVAKAATTARAGTGRG